MASGAYTVGVYDGARWVSLRGEKGDPGTGIALKGTKATVMDLPATGSSGEAWLVGGDLHVWDDQNSQWLNAGNIQGPQGIQGIKGDTGAKGDPGINGTSATVRVGTVSTGAPGSAAKVTNIGTTSAAVLDFHLPQGDVGAAGAKGDPGTAATITVGTVTDTPAGTNAKVTNTGTNTAAVLNFEIPAGQTGAKGDKGDKGDRGTDGTDGRAATISVGTVQAGAPGSTPIVNNSGTVNNAAFDFTIPTGATGATGPAGNDGAAATVTVGTVTAGASPSVTNAGTTSAAVLDFVLQTGPAGPQGPAGKDGSGVVIKGTVDGGTWPPAGPHADGDMWLIGDPVPTGAPAGAITGHGVVYNGGIFTDVGPIQGPAGPQGIQGPAGPSAVSTDANNEARLGTDSLIYVPRPAIPAASSNTPASLGTAAVGTGTTYARADHVHQMPTAAQVGAAAASHTHAAAAITGLATVAVSGEYADLKNTPAAYTLPTATASVLGGVKVGTGLDITAGVLSVQGGAGGTTVVDATTTDKGIVRLAAAADLASSGSTTAVVTAAQLISATDGLAPIASPAFTGSVTIPAGTAGAPGLHFTGDSDTGIYQAVGGTIQVTANGSQRLAIGTSVSVPAGTPFSAGGNAYPQSKGTAGQVLTTNGAGILTWEDAAAAVSPATTSALGGVIVGTGLTVQADGTIAVSFNDATTTQKGVVSLADAAAITAGTAGRVVDAAQLKSETGKCLPLLGGTMIGDISFNAGAKISDPAADTLAFSTGSSERLRIGPDGTIGWGLAVATKNQLMRCNLPITGATAAFGIRMTSQIKTDVTADAYVFQSTPSLEAGATTARMAHFRADVSGAMPATLNLQVGFWAANTIKGAKQNFGFRSDVSMAAGDYGFYDGGGADNYFKGNVGFGGRGTDAGSNEPKTAIDCYGEITVSAGSAASPAITFRGNDCGLFLPSGDAVAVATSGTERLRVDAAGKITAAAGYTPTADQDLATKKYVDDLMAASGTAVVVPPGVDPALTAPVYGGASTAGTVGATSWAFAGKLSFNLAVAQFPPTAIGVVVQFREAGQTAWVTGVAAYANLASYSSNANNGQLADFTAAKAATNVQVVWSFGLDAGKSYEIRLAYQSAVGVGGWTSAVGPFTPTA